MLERVDLLGKVPRHQRVHADIMATCQQLHAEAANILYGQNTLLFRATLPVGFPFRSSAHKVSARYKLLAQRLLINVELRFLVTGQFGIITDKFLRTPGIWETSQHIDRTLKTCPNVKSLTVSLPPEILNFLYRGFANLRIQDDREKTLRKLARAVRAYCDLRGLHIPKGLQVTLRALTNHLNVPGLQELDQAVKDAMPIASRMRRRI